MNIKKSILQLELLKELLDGEKVCLKNFAIKNSISLRTVQRYIEDIEEIFGSNLIKEDELYSFITTSLFEKNILSFDKQELEIFVDLYSLLDFDFSSKLDLNSQKFIKKLEKNYSQIYMIKQNPFENFLQKKELIFQIKNAIKNEKVRIIMYSIF